MQFIKVIVLLFASLPVILLFQNCAKFEVAQMEQSSLSMDALKSAQALPTAADSSISATVFGSPLKISTTTRLAGAIGSLTWNGKEFINSDDHGRELQSASSFDQLGECFNPTEAGSRRDGAGNTSTSKLLGINTAGNILATTVQMAFWTQAGEAYPQGCGGNANINRAQNTSNLSSHTVSKRVSIGFAGIPNAIEYLVDFHVTEHHNSAVFEALTGYMGASFSSFYTFDPASGVLGRMDHASMGEQNQPLVFSTPDQKYAMGVYSPDLPQASFSSIGYGQFNLGSSNTMKWNAVFRTGDTPAGDYNYRVYVLVGNLTQVTQAMIAVYRNFQPAAAPAPSPAASPAPVAAESLPSRLSNYRFLNKTNGEHFITNTYGEGVGAGFQYEAMIYQTFSTANNVAGAVQLYRCNWTTQKMHFVSTSSNCEGSQFEGSMGFLYGSQVANSTPVYRFFSTVNGDHLITTNYAEGVAAAYRFEAILGYAPTN